MKNKLNVTPIRACGHRVLIKVLNGEKKTEAGIIIPKEKEYTCSVAQVIEIGPTAFEGFADGQPWYGEGDTVLIVKNAGAIIDEDVHHQKGVVYKMINDNDVYARIEE